MAIAINGSSNTITGLAVGGLPDGIVDADMLAANAVISAKIADDAVTDAKQNLSGVAKAWVNFDGTTNSSGTCDMRDSFNVTSVTDNGTGDYTVNFASGVLANANYCITGSISWGSNQSRNILSVATTPNTSYTAATTTALRLESVNYGNGSAYDANSVSCLLLHI